MNKDLSYVSQIFLPKRMSNDTMPCGLVYVIAPLDMQRAHTYDSTRMPSLDGILKTCAISKNYYILAPAFKFAWSARFLHRWRFLSKNLKYGQNVKLNFFFCKKEGGKCQKMTPISNDNVSAKIFAILPCSNKYSHY